MEIPKEAEGAFDELRQAYAQVRVLFSTDARDSARKAMKVFGECMAKLEQALGLSGTPVTYARTPDPPHPEPEIRRVIWGLDPEVTQSLKEIASELKQMRVLQEKRFEDAARTSGSRRS